MKTSFAILLLFSLAAALSAANATASWGDGCTITIERSISSSNWLTTVKTVLADSGGNGCDFKDVVFEDDIPPGFGGLEGMSFSPAVHEAQGRTVKFSFASFAAGEEKTLIYRSPLRAPSSALGGFGAGVLHPAGADAAFAGLRPVYKQGSGSELFNGVALITAIGVFIALAIGAAVIHYLEKRKTRK